MTALMGLRSGYKARDSLHLQAELMPTTAGQVLDSARDDFRHEVIVNGVSKGDDTIERRMGEGRE